MESAVHRNMGQFIKLPPEIRAEIWEHFSIRPKNKLGEGNEKREKHLAIFRTCHDLYEEVSEHLYRKRSLTFYLWPMRFPWAFVSVFRGFDRWLSLKDLVDGCFRFLPYKRLRGITIEIEAPDREDPGQLILLWTKVRDLVDLLSQTGELLKIDIYLRESDASWFIGGKPQKSITIDPNHPDEAWHDSDLVLMPFCRLHNIRKACIHCPEGLDPGNLILGNITRVMERSEAFGTIKNGEPWDDDNIREDLELTQILFDDALDHLLGQTANFMRAERFGRWFDQDPTGKKCRCFEDWARICRSNDIARSHTELWKLRYRFCRYLLLNPNSVGMQMLRQQLHLKPEYRFDALDEFLDRVPFNLDSRWDLRDFRKYLYRLNTCRIMGEHAVGAPHHLMETMASRTEWHSYWCNGIPPLDSSDRYMNKLMDLITTDGTKWNKLKSLEKWSHKVWKEAEKV